MKLNIGKEHPEAECGPSAGTEGTASWVDLEIGLQYGAHDDEKRKKEQEQAQRKRCLLIGVFCAFAIILVGAVMFCNANSFGSSTTIRSAKQDEIAKMSITKHPSQEILEFYRRNTPGQPAVDRQFTPRALHLCKTADRLDQGRNGTCALAAVARTVARMSVWLRNDDVNCEADLQMHNDTIKQSAEKLFERLVHIVVESRLGYERIDPNDPTSKVKPHDRLPFHAMQLLSSPEPALIELWKEYLGCERIFVGIVPPGLARYVQRDVGIVFGVGIVSGRQTETHAVCLEEVSTPTTTAAWLAQAVRSLEDHWNPVSYTAVNSHGKGGTPDLQYTDVLSASSSPQSSSSPASHFLEGEYVIVPSWDDRVEAERRNDPFLPQSEVKAIITVLEKYGFGEEDVLDFKNEQTHGPGNWLYDGKDWRYRGKRGSRREGGIRTREERAESASEGWGPWLESWGPWLRSVATRIFAREERRTKLKNSICEWLSQNLQNVGHSLRGLEDLREAKGHKNLLGLEDVYEIVLAAVRQDGNLLRFASARLRANADIVFAAGSQNRSAVRFALLPSQKLERVWDQLTLKLERERQEMENVVV